MMRAILSLSCLWLMACGSDASELPTGSGGAGQAAAGSAGSAASSAVGGESAGTSSVAGSGGGAGAGTPGPGGASSGQGGAVSGGAGTGAVVTEAWPGPDDVKTVDAVDLFTDNVSGLTYEPATDTTPAVLWTVANIPGRLHRLVMNGESFVNDTAGGWAAGKLLQFPSGQSAADAEGVTLAASSAAGLYIASEHDNAAASTSRQSILRYDVTQAGAALTATHEWNLTALLPPAGANLGIEAISWVPDDYLLDMGFFDEAAAREYEPADYGEHGAGLFFVGVEQSGQIYGFALNHTDGAATLVASISSPFAGVMSLEYDRDLRQLWFGCDETCGNPSGILDIDTLAGSATRGRFTLRQLFARPTTLPDSNHEGIAIGPESECTSGFKPFYWTDDADVDGHTLRRDAIPCAPFP
jgi:hypothetical protein